MNVCESLDIAIETWQIDRSRGFTYVEIPLDALVVYFSDLRGYIQDLENEIKEIRENDTQLT